MTYTANEVSQISGISVETLQYYDEMGLLSPISMDTISSPHYDEDQLLDLQQVMLYREYGMPLGDIRTLMEQEQNRIDSLLSHKKRLLEKQNHIQFLMNTIDNTIEYLQQGNLTEHSRLYEGFDLALQEQYEETGLLLRPAEFKPSTKQAKVTSAQKWSKDDYLNTQREADEIYVDLCEALKNGKDPGSPSVQAIIRRHYEWISHFYTPTKEIYSGLGDLYVEHEDFKQLYAGYHPQLAEYLRDGMKIYAERQM